MKKCNICNGTFEEDELDIRSIDPFRNLYVCNECKERVERFVYDAMLKSIESVENALQYMVLEQTSRELLSICDSIDSRPKNTYNPDDYNREFELPDNI